MKSNLTSVCFVNDFNKEVSKLLADKLDLYYADVDDYLEFNMVNADEVISKAGVDYLKKLEVDSVKTVASFENAFISIEPRYFVNNKSMEHLKHSSVIVYIRLDRRLFEQYTKTLKGDKKLEFDNLMLVFDDYDKICLNNADIVINIKALNVNKIYKGLLKLVKNYYTHIN